MKVKEFLNYDGDIDVVDDVCEELYVCYCGKMILTPEGEEKFKDVLDYDIEIVKGYGTYGYNTAILHIDSPGDEWEAKLNKAKEFFYSLAGYCAADDYDRWFIEG